MRNIFWEDKKGKILEYIAKNMINTDRHNLISTLCLSVAQSNLILGFNARPCRR